MLHFITKDLLLNFLVLTEKYTEVSIYILVNIVLQFLCKVNSLSPPYHLYLFFDS